MYAAIAGNPRAATFAVTAMMLPARRSIIEGSTACVTATKDQALRFIMRSQLSRVSACVASPISKPPAM